MGNMYSDFRNLGKQIAGCICCALCLGPILTIVGIAFLVASTHDSRATELRQYNQAVNTWNGNVYQFQNASFTLWSQLMQYSLGDGITNPQIWTNGLHIVGWTFHPADPLNDSPKGSETFNPYTHLDYGWPLGVQNMPSPFANSRINTNQYYRITISDSTGSPLIDYAQVYPFLQTLVPITSCASNDEVCFQNTCQNKAGYWNGNYCYYFWQLSSICLKVHATNPSFTKWEPDVSLGVGDYGGCSWTNYIANTPSTYNAGLQTLAYTKIPSSTVNPNSFFSLGTITFNVRFYADPWITAQYVTQGSLDFGLTVKQKFEIGVACLAVGVCYTGILLCVAYSCIRKQRGQQDQNYYKVTETQTTYGGGGGVSGGPMMGQPVMGQPVYGGSGPGMYAPAPMGGGGSGYPGGQSGYQQQY